MTTSTASAPAHLPVSAALAARKAAAAKAQATRQARIAAGLVAPGTGAGAKAAATRKARLEAQAVQAAELAAPVVVPVGAAAKRSVEMARKFDEAAARHEQMVARFAHLAEMKRAVVVVNTLGLRQPGTRGRKALMVTADNAASILARGAKKGIVA